MTESRTYSQDLDGVYYALQDLAAVGGGSTIAIAAHLYALGVRGERKNATCCPVANWLRLLFGADCEPVVDEGSVHVQAFEDGPLAQWIDPPDAIDDLISAIDSGGYSDLIEEHANVA